MAYEQEKINMPKSDSWHRNRRRKQALLRQRMAFLAVLAVSGLVLTMVLLRSCHGRQQAEVSTPPATTLPPVVTTPPATEPPEPETVITLIAGGDINITDKVVSSGQTPGGYDFTGNFLDIAALLAGADGAVVNLEGNVVGAPYGSGKVSTPPALLQALSNAGVDFVQTANSHAITNGIAGLRSTLDGIRQAGMRPLGTFASKEEYEQTQGFTIVNIQGIRVALVAFTKGMSGYGLPEGSENLVNLLYTDYASTYQTIDEAGIKTRLEAVAAQQPDVTIALLHWGSEFNSIVSTRQEKIATLMLENGVDAIIGTHSHYVQKIAYDREKGQVIAYSLGDLYGDGEKTGTNYSILLELEITRDNITGQTRITGCDYIPLYTLTPERDGEGMRVVRILEHMAMYENNHVNKISDKAYENMKSALAKIKAKTELYE
jgi:poly-gamma-glutamate synthesis protein (capsule biosynthesis protein)